MSAASAANGCSLLLVALNRGGFARSAGNGRLHAAGLRRRSRGRLTMMNIVIVRLTTGEQSERSKRGEQQDGFHSVDMLALMNRGFRRNAMAPMLAWAVLML
jgi:hypothetical protein